MSYFNVRVYGLLINAKNEVLLSDEQEFGQKFTKFPGGGLELGEGLIDALKREFIEECNAEIEVTGHFYTTDFYEKSSFNDSQVISIYYLVKELHPLKIPFKTNIFDFDEGATQSFRWVSINSINEDDVTFKTDKTVINLLKKSIT
ncbi:NUDIX domain-containing protein [Pedobacter boryungensis]|uniref:NUDIX domain-containing protein n=1 Tax=Pedobacter boryungensis TaxID=869962 RepID=A0ABX2D9I4_9SPHI|nr:NUDIX domain-containing protein [Pedobacter boryungensis]NQX30689.1 NUDIX domain-containing protein [Pedobacter boryungensis]